jgi:hypothetical protein
MNIAFTKRSSNAKVGPIPVTTSSKDTCPPSCPLLDNGCYASAGFHTNMHWNKVTEGVRGAPLDALCAQVQKLPESQLWRHNVAGDLLGHSDHIDGPALFQLSVANTGRRGFTYTHYPIDKGDNLHYVRGANTLGFTVNVSCNTVTEAATTWHDTQLPVVTIVAPEFWERGDTVNTEGATFVRCPAEQSDTVTCATCKLCSVSERKVIVGFTVHGTKSKVAAIVARGDILAVAA